MVTSAGGHGTGEQGIPGEDPRHLLLFTKPSRDRERVLKGRGVEGERSEEGQRFRPRLEATSSDKGPVSPRGTRGPRPSPLLHKRHFQPPKLARLSLDTQSHTRSPPSARRVRAGVASPAPTPSRGRRAPHPRTHLPPVAPAAGSASARTATGPAPLRSLLPAPPSPRPREVGPAAAPESRSGLTQLSRSLPPRLLGGWADPTRS